MTQKFELHTPTGHPIRIAIVHDWLVTYGGAERVLEKILHIFPDADLFSLIDTLPQEQRFFTLGKKAFVSFLQKMPFVKKKYRSYLAFMPLAIEQFDFSSYDIVLSSSYAMAKGAITGPNQLHICYCHSPIRYAWDLQHQYFREAGLDHGVKHALALILMHYIRLWDYRTASGVDFFIANSQFISRRIAKTYRRESTVIYPPVDVAAFQLRADKDDFYLLACRHVPYKKAPLIVEAFNAMPDKRLVVIGEGPEFHKVKAIAGPNVEVLGFVSGATLRDYMQRARAFVYAAEEDFGIVLVEAQACGTPVITYAKGGALEIIKHNETGILFERQTKECIIDAVNALETSGSKITSEACRKNAMRFSEEVFNTSLKNKISELWENHIKTLKRVFSAFE